MTAFNWMAIAMDFDARTGGAPDLELDNQGWPRLAYVHGESAALAIPGATPTVQKPEHIPGAVGDR